MALVLVAVPLLSAQAQDKLPPPIDPQSWKLQEDMTWDELLPNPVIDWMKDLNREGIVNPKAAGNKEPIRGALVLVDFWDRPFIASQPIGSDMLGYYLLNPDGTLQKTITHNPIISIDEKELAQWMADFIGIPQDVNHYVSVDGFWRENSYGKWSVEVDAYGPYTLQGFELEYGLDYTTWADYPPTFRRGAASGTSGRRSLTTESVALARDNGLYMGDYDFFFILHSGYDESNAWLEFGPMQWASPQEVPYQYGAGAKMDQIEEILTAHPEYLLSLDARGGYNQATTIRDAAAEVRTRTANGTLDEYVFKFPQVDRNWYNTYSWGNAAPTRYVPWSAWLYATAAWASSGSSSVPRSPANGGGNVSKQYSQQGENNGMGTYAHEFGHILSHADNYENPWAITRSPRADYWDLMSRGDRNGPGGYHARWTVPGGLEADGVPSHMMFLSKKRAEYFDNGDIYEVSVAQLKAGTPVVANVVPRNVPLNNNKNASRPEGLYPWLEDYGLVSPNYYKAIELTFDNANPDVATLQTVGWSWTAFRAGRMAVEVVQRTGYDSFCNDNGVLISRLATGTGQTRAVVDSHLYDIKMVDYYLNGDPVYYVIGHSAQLNDSLFHAGTSITDTGYYEGSMRRWEPRNGRDIVSGNTVNEFYDSYNKLHFYILDKQLIDAKYGELISYQVGLLHDNGKPVGGELDVTLAAVEAEKPGRVAVAYFDITNTGEATDIIRVGAAGGLEATLLNNVYAVGAGETVSVPVYFELPATITAKDVDGLDIVFTASSESNKEKVSVETIAAEDLVAFNFYGYMVSEQTAPLAGDTVFVDVMLKGNINYTQFNAAVTYDPSLLEYVGYANLSGLVAEVKAAGNQITMRNVPSLNMLLGASCLNPVRIATLKFKVKAGIDDEIVATHVKFAAIDIAPTAGVKALIAPGKALEIIFGEFGLDTLPDPLDPQSWKMQRDMTWEDWTPNPVIDWISDDTVKPARVLRGALVLVDFPDRKFVVTEPTGSGFLGNPVIGDIAKEDLADFWHDYLIVPSELNNYVTVNSYWKENTYGRQDIELESFGPFTLSRFEFQYGSLGITAVQRFDTFFPRGTAMATEAYNLAKADGVKFFDDAGAARFDFIFFIHAGYDPSGLWQEVGEMMFLTRNDINYPFSGLAKLETIENMITAPDFDLATAYPGFYLFTKPTGTQIEQAYQSYKEVNFAKEYAAAKELDDTLTEAAFETATFRPAFDVKFAGTDTYKAIVPDILLGNILRAKQVANSTAGNAMMQWAATRYVPWTTWFASMNFWTTEGTVTDAGYRWEVSTQAESDGMATFAHEFGHIRGLPDNYNAPFTLPMTRSYTGPWELMSRGSFGGPGGNHQRYQIPAVMGGASPPNQVLDARIINQFTAEEDIVNVTIDGLKTAGPVITEIVARNVPTNNSAINYGVNGKRALKLTGFTDQTPRDNNTMDPTNNSGGNLMDNPDALRTKIDPVKWSWGTFNSGVVHDSYTIEVVDRTGYDSFMNDHGVLILKNASRKVNYQPNQFIIDAHPGPLGIVDFIRPNGDVAHMTDGDQLQLVAALFHAGVHNDPDYSDTFTGNAMYGPIFNDNTYAKLNQPIVTKVAGNTVNEFTDGHNKLHFYILDKIVNKADNGEYLSYQVAVRSIDAAAHPVGGALTLTAGKFEAAKRGKYAVQHFTIKDTGADSADIIRINLSGELAGKASVLNNLYAIQPDGTIEFAVYIEAADGALHAFPAGKLTVSVTSETNTLKSATF